MNILSRLQAILVEAILADSHFGSSNFVAILVQAYFGSHFGLSLLAATILADSHVRV